MFIQPDINEVILRQLAKCALLQSFGLSVIARSIEGTVSVWVFILSLEVLEEEFLHHYPHLHLGVMTFD